VLKTSVVGCETNGAFECLTSAEDSHRERKTLNRKKKKKLSPLSLFLLFCFSLSLSCFFWLPFLSLEVFLSQQEALSRFPLSRKNSDESARGFQRAAPLCCSETRASTREKRERERERDERESARAQTNTLYRKRKFLSFALSLRRYREE